MARIPNQVIDARHARLTSLVMYIWTHYEWSGIDRVCSPILPNLLKPQLSLPSTIYYCVFS